MSKMTVNFCLGVPTPTSMKYCVPFLLKIGIWSTCVRRSVCSAGNMVSSPRSSWSFVMGAWCSSKDPSSAVCPRTTPSCVSSLHRLARADRGQGGEVD